MELIIEKLKKVKELADRGEAGEALVAREKLHMLLSKTSMIFSRKLNRENPGKK